MSYQEMSDRYRDPAERGRYEMCVAEQGGLYAQGAAGPDQALGAAVVGGDADAVEALIRSICAGPNSAALGHDPDLLAAVQAAWPGVASALHPA